MKVNTDGVLLGAWFTVPEFENGRVFRVLDIGTGTGLIALMAGQRLAQRGGAGVIMGVEIDENACKDALVNFKNAPWREIEFTLKNQSLQEFAEDYREEFDIILSNPPYFIDSLKNTDNSKSVARHTDTLSQREILFYGVKLLRVGGTLAVVLPVTEGEEFLRKVDFLWQNTPEGERCFEPYRVCKVHTVEHKPAKRLLIELNLIEKESPDTQKKTLSEERLIMLSNGLKTVQYNSLVGEFYL